MARQLAAVFAAPAQQRQQQAKAVGCSAAGSRSSWLQMSANAGDLWGGGVSAKVGWGWGGAVLGAWHLVAAPTVTSTAAAVAGLVCACFFTGCAAGSVLWPQVHFGPKFTSGGTISHQTTGTNHPVPASCWSFTAAVHQPLRSPLPCPARHLHRSQFAVLLVANKGIYTDPAVLLLLLLLPSCKSFPPTVQWGKKAIGRKTTGTGRMQYLKDLPRRFKNGFREGESAGWLARVLGGGGVKV